MRVLVIKEVLTWLLKKHMTLEDRITIETSLKNKESFQTIADRIGKNPTSVSREIRHLDEMISPLILKINETLTKNPQEV